MTTEGEPQNSNPEKTQSHNLIERLSMYTETLCKSREDTLSFLIITAVIGTSAAIYTYLNFENNNQPLGFICAGVFVISSIVVISGLIILAKQPRQ